MFVKQLVTVFFLKTVLSDEQIYDGGCTIEMFNGQQDALLACQAQHALQQNWYPDPIQGLFSYQTWNGMDGFWQNGVLIETMANSLLYMNNTRYKTVVTESYRDLYELLLAYGPQPSFDDMAWYGLAYTRIYEVTGQKKFLELSVKIFNWIWKEGWDTTVCEGGIWFDNSYGGKETIENVQAVQLAARLARLNKDEKLKNKALLVWNWIVKTGLVDISDFKVYDGISMSTCKVDKSSPRYTYTAGVCVGALIELAQITNNKTYLHFAHNVTRTVITTIVNEDGILSEPCDKDRSCNLDANIFKGIFMKNLRYLLDYDSSSSNVILYRNFIKKNIGSLVKNNMCDPEQFDLEAENPCHIVYMDGPPSYNQTGPVFDSVWFGPYNESRPIQQTSALDLLLAGVPQGVRCIKQPHCSYDPTPPPPHDLTCNDDPCPTGQDCCQFSGRYSCCNPNQVCQDNICV